MTPFSHSGLDPESPTNSIMDLDNNKYYQQALQYIADTDLSELEPGKHLLDGDNLFVNIVDSQMKTPE